MGLRAVVSLTGRLIPQRLRADASGCIAQTIFLSRRRARSLFRVMEVDFFVFEVVKVEARTDPDERDDPLHHPVVDGPGGLVDVYFWIASTL